MFQQFSWLKWCLKNAWHDLWFTTKFSQDITVYLLVKQRENLVLNQEPLYTGLNLNIVTWNYMTTCQKSIEKGCLFVKKLSFNSVIKALVTSIVDNKKDLWQVLFDTIYCKFYYFCNELPLVITCACRSDNFQGRH